jgi:hypothetical protein
MNEFREIVETDFSYYTVLEQIENKSKAEKIRHLQMVLFKFKEHSQQYWCNVLYAYKENGHLFGFDELTAENHYTTAYFFGSLGYDLSERADDEIETIYEIRLKDGLSTFEDRCNSLLKYVESEQTEPEPLDLPNNTKEAVRNSAYNKIAIPQNNIDGFLCNDLNIELFESAEYRLLDYNINILEYFNLLFSEFNFFVDNLNDYLKIKEHFVIPDFKTISIEDKEINFQNYLYYQLRQLIKYHFPIDERKGVIKKCCERFELVEALITSFVFGTQSEKNLSTFETVKEAIEGLDPKVALLDLTNTKFEILQQPTYYTESPKELESLIKNIDFEIERLESLLKIEINEPQQTEPESVDLSATSAVEKIIYLNELGIIDFLRTKPEFALSTNLMATVLSAITDVKAKTLQTSLNRLINNDTADQRHPYKSNNTVNKVRQTLIDVPS